jgi:protein-disulfide isomerase
MTMITRRHIALSLLLAACAAEPSPEQLRSTLTRHPEILYDAIRAHPQEFVTLLDSAARATSSARHASSAQAEERRIEAEIAHPRKPDLTHGVYFGSPSAPITIVEYTDFECPYCRQEHPVIVELFKRYGDRVRLVVKEMPMPFHPRAMPAARMFEAVAMQDASKAPKFYDIMYDQQERLIAEGDLFLDETVRSLGLDVARARRDAASDAVTARISADVAEAQRFGITGTPGFLVNGVLLEGAYPAETFAHIIDRQLAPTRSR